MDDEMRNMIQENNELLKEVVELSRENHKRIKAIRAHIRQSFWARIIYWVLIVLVTAGAFYALKPMVDTVVNQYRSISTQINTTNDLLHNPGQLIERSFNPAGVSGLSEVQSISDLADPSFLEKLFLGSSSSQQDEFETNNS